MKQPLLIHIPKPCHENWNAMTPEQQGRYCAACATTVIDFSVMTDHDILKYMTSNTGNMCGRFSNDQLDRVLKDTPVKKKKIGQWLVAFAGSLLTGSLFSNKGMSQGTPAMVGKMAVSYDTAKNTTVKGKPVMIKGQVKATDTSAIKHAVIKDTVTGNKVHCNRDGKFVMEKHSLSDTVTASAEGYESRVVPVSMLTNNSDTAIILNKLPTPSLNSEHYDEVLVGSLGGFKTYKVISKPDTISVIARKVFNNYFFKVTPNPVNANGELTVTISKAGNYKVELFDNNGKLMHIQEAEVVVKGGRVQLHVPAIAAKGVYYIRLTDAVTGKEYVDKIVVS